MEILLAWMTANPEQVALIVGTVASTAVGFLKRFGGTRFKWAKLGINKLNEAVNKPDA